MPYLYTSKVYGAVLPSASTAVPLNEAVLKSSLNQSKSPSAASLAQGIISDTPNDTLYPITDLDLREMQDYEFEIYGRYLWDCSIKL